MKFRIPSSLKPSRTAPRPRGRARPALETLEGRTPLSFAAPAGAHPSAGAAASAPAAASSRPAAPVAVDPLLAAHPGEFAGFLLAAARRRGGGAGGLLDPLAEDLGSPAPAPQ
jgi:hypothetical protein